MEITTNVQKGMYGWTAETYIPLEGNHELHFTTSKRFGKALTTTMNRVDRSEDGCSYHYILLGDFHETLLMENVQVTQKAVLDQHQRALESLDDARMRCIAFYSNKEKP